MDAIGDRSGDALRMDTSIRRATAADAAEIARMLHDFNTGLDEPGPGAEALAGPGGAADALLRARALRRRQASDAAITATSS